MADTILMFRGNACLLALVGVILLAPIGNPVSTISQSDIAAVKAYADAFNQSRNYNTSNGPAEYYCWTTGTFLAHKYCYDMPTCMQTANLVCSASGQEGCMVDVLAAHILAYKNGVDKLNSAYSSFMAGYNAFSPSSIAGSLSQMDSSFGLMKTAADEVSQSKLRLPDKIPCPCTNSSNCCIGRCPEARFNYTAITSGKSEIAKVRLKNCSDGTPGGQCSLNKPAECTLGELADNAARCGCPTGMAIAPDGKACQFTSCSDNGTLVALGACSPNMNGLKCLNGVLEGNQSGCTCPTVTSQVCNITNVTKHLDVTYIFDRGDKKTVAESYTFEKKVCYSVQSNYTGLGCKELVNSAVNGTPIFESPDPQPPASIVKVPCSRCPAACTRNPPDGLKCGSCSCPPNLGFCRSTGERADAAGTPAYCKDELLVSQKEDYLSCTRGFECKAGECRKGACYNRQKDPLQLFIDWAGGIFGIKKQLYT